MKKFIGVLGFLVMGLFFSLNHGLAEEKPSSGDLIVKAWHAHGDKDVKATFDYTQQIIDLYKNEADKEQASLRVLPKNRPDIEAMGILNDVATAYFIQGESFRDQGKSKEAIQLFKVVVEKYCYAQAWDP
ncbi:MAG: tetratricopeptide repeat protein, partial [Candidatus Omnitrophica bacterium]|nr:tetratricopeptide repeat protein [Candidatus Omnitrophota bacterium]